MQLTLLTRRAHGDLVRDGFTQAALRAALLVDLQSDGRLDDTGVDCTPVGFLPIDELLREIERHPKRSTDWWIGKGPHVQQQLSAEWIRNRRWTDADVATVAVGTLGTWSGAVSADQRQVETQRSRLGQLANGFLPLDSEPAALAALAQLAGLLDDVTTDQPDVPSPSLLDACGAERWLVEAAARLITAGRRAPRVSLPPAGFTGGM